MRRRDLPFAVIVVAAILVAVYVRHRDRPELNPVWNGGVRNLGPLADGAIEYRLPCDTMPADDKRRLSAWLRQFVGLSPDEAASILGQRWTTQAPTLEPLQAALVQFKPHSIVVRRDHSLLGLKRDSDDAVLYLPAPLSPTQLDRTAAFCRVEERPLIREFLRMCAGLREDVKDSGIVHDKPQTAGDMFGLADENPWFKGYDVEWEHALILFRSNNEGVLALRPDGKVAWLSYEIVRDTRKSLPEFMGEFAERLDASGDFGR